MIVKEYHKTRSDGVILYRTYSDLKQTIIQVETNTEYNEAVDVESATYTYIESGRLITDGNKYYE